MENRDNLPIMPEDGKIGEYSIEAISAESERWISFRAYDAAKKPVTIKTRKSKPGNGEETGDTHPVFQELLLLQIMRHPAIPTLHGVHSQDDDSLYVIQEYLDGETLAERVRREGPMTQGQALAIMWEIAEALVYMQNQKPQVILRNLNPDMIVLTGSRRDFAPRAVVEESLAGRVKISDLTTAVLKPEPGSDISSFTRSIGYTAPDEVPNLATDIYSFGAVLFFLVTGQSLAEFGGRIPSLRRLKPDVSEAVARLIEDCTQEMVENRIANARELRRRLLALENMLAETGEEVRLHADPEVDANFEDEEDADPLTEMFRSINNYLEKVSGFHLFMILMILSILFLMLRGAAASNFNECTYNLKDLGADMERYAGDNCGLYPESLGQLVPRYRQRIPDCPGAGKETYTSGYEVSTDRKAFTISCQGKNHSLLTWHPNYPRFTSRQGFIPDLGQKPR